MWNLASLFFCQIHGQSHILAISFFFKELFLACLKQGLLVPGGLDLPMVHQAWRELKLSALSLLSTQNSHPTRFTLHYNPTLWILLPSATFPLYQYTDLTTTTTTTSNPLCVCDPCSHTLVLNPYTKQQFHIPTCNSTLSTHPPQTTCTIPHNFFNKTLQSHAFELSTQNYNSHAAEPSTLTEIPRFGASESRSPPLRLRPPP